MNMAPAPSTSRKDVEMSDDEGLEFVVQAKAKQSLLQEDDKPKMLQISGQMVQQTSSAVNSRSDFLKSLKEKKMQKTSSTIVDIEELKRTFQTTEL